MHKLQNKPLVAKIFYCELLANSKVKWTKKLFYTAIHLSIISEHQEVNYFHGVINVMKYTWVIKRLYE